jgi:RNA polymerase sigma-70 factor (ECF subfamily)
MTSTPLNIEVGGTENLHTRLAADLRSRRPGVIAELLPVFGREIQGVAYLIVRSHADAEEVAMDTFVTAWQRGGDLRDDRALRAWLLQIATRHALSRMRRVRWTQPLDLTPEVVAHRSSEPSAERVALAAAVATLPDRMRAAIALHYFAGLRVAEVADALGTSDNTVRTQIREGLARLRIELDVPLPDEGGEVDVRSV